MSRITRPYFFADNRLLLASSSSQPSKMSAAITRIAVDSLALRQPEELFGKGLDRVAKSKKFSPLLWDSLLAVVCPSELGVDGTGGVGIVAQIDGEERPLPEGVAPIERPEGGWVQGRSPLCVGDVWW
jgi:hypothetical protein